MGIADLLAFLGDRNVARRDLPAELAAYVDDALGEGLVIEDCREHLVGIG